MNPSYKDIGEYFAKQYYQMYDTGNIDQLASMYHDSALLTFEGDQKQGKEAIRAKHGVLAAKTCHNITTIDCQPTYNDNGVTVSIVGQIKTEGEDKVLGFTHMFIIRPFEDGNFYITNEVFRLALHNF
ncbi:uncharacterized protein LOC132714447 [Ruditapes philippinarum]|uniref:uncharacterized protein LOC132714447 n=1 Tax=Ruditapes philippinarum TaxID=129788 RepID=UPI00295B5AEC|nr:uncharacterized protein LOC132714447 [Ruditapes philippinarum]